MWCTAPHCLLPAQATAAQQHITDTFLRKAEQLALENCSMDLVKATRSESIGEVNTASPIQAHALAATPSREARLVLDLSARCHAQALLTSRGPGVQHLLSSAVRRRSASGPRSWRRLCLCCTTTARPRCSTSCWAACLRTAPQNARDRCCWSTSRMVAACCQLNGRPLRRCVHSSPAFPAFGWLLKSNIIISGWRAQAAAPAGRFKQTLLAFCELSQTEFADINRCTSTGVCLLTSTDRAHASPDVAQQM